MPSSIRIHLLDELVADAAGDLVDAAALEAAVVEQASASRGSRPRALVEILLRRDLLSLRQANNILSATSRRVIFCPNCKESQVLAWRRCKGALTCLACGVGLEGLQSELCLPSAKVSTRAEEYGPSLVGRIDGNVHIRRRLSEGRYAGWYAGRMRPRGEPVVLMEISPEITEDPTRLTSLEESFATARLVQTPARPLVFELVTVAGRRFAVQSPLEGPSAADLAAERGPLTPLDMLRVMAPVAAAIQAAHARGLFGFDLFPESIVLEGHTEARLMDLATGFLRRRVPGQVAFLAPETIRGATADAGADIHAFCAVCWFLLAGERPYSGEDPEELEARIITGGAPSIAARRADLHSQLAELLDSGLAADPADRPASMDVVSAQVEQARLHHRWQAEQQRDSAAGAVEAAKPAPARPSEPAPQPEPAALPHDDPGLKEINDLERRAKDHIEHRRFMMATRALNRILDYEQRGPGYEERVAKARWVLKRISTKRKS